MGIVNRWTIERIEDVYASDVDVEWDAPIDTMKEHSRMDDAGWIYHLQQAEEQHNV